MKLLPNQVDESCLLRLGEEAVSLLERGDFQTLADRFGYALAFGNDPAVVIEEELRSCIAEFRVLPERQFVVSPCIEVKYFQRNNAGLFAVIECVFMGAEGCPILAELIVTSSGEDKYVSLEQVSLASAPVGDVQT
ncbi:hypothetical protein CfE428DRAFT_4440 [Chthoniobacter flavus Ellin428]|uniref:Uncharacterized protein n=1 Tax=Chthoniobacter flavus Ellin428 TaxID=497964 RepID=B4D6A1_9BACT|nr:hypothetical protein [Chthoniobacter flavus]EDY18010.1 hypothetical protein CfE428DRAFT_4440 [Chthoniobacter flavus Ellin428]TCO88252.1 hypothetical protein EV701_11848 [Chthoniobacter flavus]